jgi:hypothetical protein
MTLPDERYRAVMQTREFLSDLLDRKKYPRVPLQVRQQALWCLRHYPSGWDMEAASRGVPEVFVKQMDPLHRLIVQHEQETDK